jgi:hypothetical protein
MVEKQNKWRQLGNAVSELEFITSLFSWIFNFLSRIAEPLMTLAVIYTIIVSGLPQAMVPALYNAAMAIMIGSPEVILPGAFIMAGQQQQSGNKRAWMLFCVCVLFILLTSLTLADLFIFHFDTKGTAILMCARCVTGVSYSILVRVVNHEQGSRTPVRSQPAFDPQAFMNQVLAQYAEMNQTLVHHLDESQEAFRNQFTQSNMETINQALRQIEEAGASYLEKVAACMETFTSHARENQSHPRTAKGNEHRPHRSEEFTNNQEARAGIIQFHEREEVHEEPELLSLQDVQKNERANREQVCTFIRDYWREHRCKPTIKFIRRHTGCSQGLASTCCQLLASEMSA